MEADEDALYRNKKDEIIIWLRVYITKFGVDRERLYRSS